MDSVDFAVTKILNFQTVFSTLVLKEFPLYIAMYDANWLHRKCKYDVHARSLYPKTSSAFSFSRRFSGFLICGGFLIKNRGSAGTSAFAGGQWVRWSANATYATRKLYAAETSLGKEWLKHFEPFPAILYPFQTLMIWLSLLSNQIVLSTLQTVGILRLIRGDRGKYISYL